MFETERSWIKKKTICMFEEKCLAFLVMSNYIAYVHEIQARSMLKFRVFAINSNLNAPINRLFQSQVYMLWFGSQKIPVFCHMENFGCGDGGWTLAMKINGSKVRIFHFVWYVEFP